MPVAGQGEGLELDGGVAHEDGVAGDLEHGEVVPVVADGHDAGGCDVAGGGEAEECVAFGAAGGEDVEEREVALGVLGAAEGEFGEDAGVEEQMGLGAGHAGYGAAEHCLNWRVAAERVFDGVDDLEVALVGADPVTDGGVQVF